MMYNMEKQNFIKKLSPEEQFEILNFICDKFSIDDQEKYTLFYNSMIEYIKTVRREIESFKKNVDEIIGTFSKLGYDNSQIIEILTKEPSLLHADKDALFWRMLVLGKVYDSKTNSCVRNDYVVMNPRILRTSHEVMYARIKYLESDEGRAKLRKTGFFTIRQIIKNTNEEFRYSYDVDKNTLLRLYPFDNVAQLDIVSWPENKQLLENIYNSGRKI